MKHQPDGRETSTFQQVSDNEAHQGDDRQVPSMEQLVQQIKETADKLIRDQANRGDVKLLSTALKELRYSFKVFGPYKGRRKITVFGSARIKTDHPAYQTAVQFSKKLAQ